VAGAAISVIDADRLAAINLCRTAFMLGLLVQQREQFIDTLSQSKQKASTVHCSRGASP
jgi:hypothetical protein